MKLQYLQPLDNISSLGSAIGAVGKGINDTVSWSLARMDKEREAKRLESEIASLNALKNGQEKAASQQVNFDKEPHPYKVKSEDLKNSLTDSQIQSFDLQNSSISEKNMYEKDAKQYKQSPEYSLAINNVKGAMANGINPDPELFARLNFFDPEIVKNMLNNRPNYGYPNDEKAAPLLEDSAIRVDKYLYETLMKRAKKDHGDRVSGFFKSKDGEYFVANDIFNIHNIDHSKLYEDGGILRAKTEGNIYIDKNEQKNNALQNGKIFDYIVKYEKSTGVKSDPEQYKEYLDKEF